MKDDNKSYEWDNLEPHEKSWFKTQAKDFFNRRNQYLYQYTEEEVNQKAKEIFEMKEILFDNRYFFPIAARELISRYDIIIENDGVKILTGIDDINESRRIKKALTLFIESPSEFDRGRSMEHIESCLNDIEKESIFESKVA